MVRNSFVIVEFVKLEANKSTKVLFNYFGDPFVFVMETLKIETFCTLCLQTLDKELLESLHYSLVEFVLQLE